MTRCPEREIIPAWYELSVKDEKTLLIRIHVAAMDRLEKIKKNLPIVTDYEKLSTDSFTEFKIGKSWGFGEVLISCKSDHKDWLAYECILPVLRSDKTNILGLRSTLAMLFTTLWLFEESTDCKRPQLMVVDNFVVGGYLWGGALNVTLTPTVIAYLSKIPNNFCLTDVEKAMIRADAHMWPERKSSSYFHYFQALCRQPKWINFTVPGNACGLDPDGYYDTSLDRGYSLGPHNTDTSLQQLTLLVGLAKLQDLIRKDSCT